MKSSLQIEVVNLRCFCKSNCASFSLVLTPVPASEVCISIARCFGRFKESRDSLVRLVISLLSIVHNVTTEFAWIHHPPYKFHFTSVSISSS